MDTMTPDTGHTPSPATETAAERERRIAYEAEMIAEADADFAAGLYVDADEVHAWIESMGTDQELPMPATRQR
jgi:predicted transcriptional regulator